MFVWTVPTIVAHLIVTRRSWVISFPVSHGGEIESAFCERFSKLPRISFDYAIMEKAGRVLVVEAAFDWDDIGGWRAVAKYLARDTAAMRRTAR